MHPLHTPLLSLLTALLVSLPFSGVAADAANELAATEEEELARLLAVIDEQTELATKSRVNADFVPGIVTVLRGRDLELRGVRNVWEALGLVPGVELGMEASGRRHILIRGVGLTYASESAKIMVNGVSYNTTTFAFADAVFAIPVEQVERIELIRGPGSAVYGEFAYAGVINVITHQKGAKLFTKGTSRQDRLGGGFYSFGSTDGDALHGTLNIAAENSGRGGVASGYDAAYTVDPAYSYAPGETNEVSQIRTAMLDLGYRDYSLKMAWLSNGFGDLFGINNDLPPDSRVVTTDRFDTIELSRAITWTPSAKGRLSFGQRVFTEDKARLFIDKSSYWCDAIGSPCTGPLPDDIETNLQTEESARYASADLRWSGLANDILYVELSYTDVKLNDHAQSINADPVTWEPLTEMVAWDTLLTPGTERHIFSTTVQDEHRFTEGLLATAGVRYDNYSDVGSSVTPRLAGVWTVNRNQLLKAQFSSAFRPPTFYEQAGSAEPIRSSTVDTYELGYVARDDDAVARLTTYYSRMERVIGFSDAGYSPGDISLRGIEMEYDRQLGRNVRLDGNLSLMRAYDNVAQAQMPSAASRLASLALTYTPSRELLLNTQYRYIGPHRREAGDSREALDSYQTLDVTVSVLNVMARGVTFRSGVRNLFDADIRYPSPPNSYPADYPRPGRYWWAGLQYDYR